MKKEHLQYALLFLITDLLLSCFYPVIVYDTNIIFGISTILKDDYIKILAMFVCIYMSINNKESNGYFDDDYNFNIIIIIILTIHLMYIVTRDIIIVINEPDPKVTLLWMFEISAIGIIRILTQLVYHLVVFIKKARAKKDNKFYTLNNYFKYMCFLFGAYFFILIILSTATLLTITFKVSYIFMPPVYLVFLTFIFMCLGWLLTRNINKNEIDKSINFFIIFVAIYGLIYYLPEIYNEIGYIRSNVLYITNGEANMNVTLGSSIRSFYSHMGFVVTFVIQIIYHYCLVKKYNKNSKARLTANEL